MFEMPRHQNIPTGIQTTRQSTLHRPLAQHMTCDFFCSCFPEPNFFHVLRKQIH